MNTELFQDLPAAPTRRTKRAAHADCSPQHRITRALLGYGMLAGPWYVGISLTQAAVRDGFDLRRHAWSLLANGTGGWVQIANLILTGAMVAAAAVGYRRALRDGIGARWVPQLLAVYGASLMVAGAFRADPMGAFPVGTPDGPPVAPTLSGTVHLAAGGVGFLALVLAALVMARRFGSQGRRRWAIGSAVTGVAFLAGFLGIATNTPSPVTTLAFTAGVLLVWAWLTSTSAHLYAQLR